MARVYAGWGPSQAFYREKIYLQLGFSSLEDYLVEAWEGRFLKLDANDILAMVNTWQRGDISDNPLYQVDIHQALGTIKAKAIIMPSETDNTFRRWIAKLKHGKCLTRSFALFHQYGGILPEVLDEIQQTPSLSTGT